MKKRPVTMSPLSEGVPRIKPIFSDSIVHISLITDEILEECSPATMLCLGKTCSAAYSAVKLYIQSKWKIDRLLKRFFTDPLSFRSLQARTATLISGSTALQFFDRSFYPTSDLDLYVHAQHCREVGRWLIREGYVFGTSKEDHRDFEKEAEDDEWMITDPSIYDFVSGILCIWTFLKQRRDGPELKVQIIVAESAPMKVILGFHSTCVMNVISYEKAYCLFPRATLEEHCSLVSTSRASTKSDNDRTVAVEKYRSRGFRIITTIINAHSQRRNPKWAVGRRRIGDGTSWVVELNTEGIEHPPPASPGSRRMTCDPVALTTWFMDCDQEGQTVQNFQVLESSALRYPYVLRPVLENRSIGLNGLTGVWTPRLPKKVKKMLESKEKKELPKRKLDAKEWSYYDAAFIKLCRTLRA